VKSKKYYAYAFFIAVLVHITVIYAGEHLMNRGNSNPERPKAGTRPVTLLMYVSTDVDGTHAKESASNSPQTSREQGESTGKSAKYSHADVSAEHTVPHDERSSVFKIGDPFYEQPRPRATINPVYPLGSYLRKEEGVVLCRVRVSARGKVETIELLRSSGFPALDKAACKEINRTEFIPALYKKEPVAGEVVIRIRFQLTNRQ
jgi:protein TonB